MQYGRINLVRMTYDVKSCYSRDIMKKSTRINGRWEAYWRLHVEGEFVERRREDPLGRREGDEGVVASLHLEDDPALPGQVDSDVLVGESRYGRCEISIWRQTAAAISSIAPFQPYKKINK